MYRRPRPIHRPRPAKGGEVRFPLLIGNSLTLNVSGGLTFEVPALAGAAPIVGDADAFGPGPRS